ncbi:Glycosyl transferase, group 1 family protein [Flavobacterium anhuiense]|uniref:Glycosyl transferase, group 1 family protein n=1 Tax=Flavobacterium anhuiense TaxID=459526 RepID=A0A444W295_9FLAO|nr:DUF1972 domain-containing protein [Flavobacterium anhuiense]RYJ39874.1 Glycosyl transferase, group 1 family protein [Flavobacterium anhuiense]
MKIAILGTRGIPNNYGGFEQFAEIFAVYLTEKKHDVYVYNSHKHIYKEKNYKGVNIIHQYDPEYKIGTVGQFIYDLNCILDSRNRNFDIILQLGYTSNSIWSFLLPKKSIIITNMDGLEWKRTKYSKLIQRFLKFAEKKAVKSSDYLVADSLGIKKYLKEKYNTEAAYIAYGADLFSDPKEEVLSQYNVEKNNYNLLIARFEPENNIEVILDGIAESQDNKVMLVIGSNDNSYGDYLKKKFYNYRNIRFIGGVYNKVHLDNLRYFSNLYFHGHSVGGTNPSLLEAMATKALIVAHNNEFNRAILQQNAFYFSNAECIKHLIKTIKRKDYENIVEDNFKTIIQEFNWNKINESYFRLFEKSLK